MPKIEILGLPVIEEAHIFSTPKYDNILPEKEGCIEVSYIAEGKLYLDGGDSSDMRHQFDISCTFRTAERRVKSDAFHEHHTVCFHLPYRESDGDNVITLPYVLRFDALSEAHRLIDEIIRIYTLYPDRSNLISGLILQLLDEINEQSRRAEFSQRDAASLYVYKAKAYIYNNLTRPITQREVADKLNITPEYFSSIFKAACGLTPMRFINRIKLMKIRMLMAREGMKLYEAAEQYGFSDPNYVSKLYKKLFGQNITDSITVKFCDSETSQETEKSSENEISKENGDTPHG